MAEELKGQLAESLPNAVGIFADALYGDGTAGSGDKAKLFKEMELGKLGLEELTKVIDYMATLTKKDLLAQMLNTPAKKFTAMKNQWILMVEALNDGGVLDVMLKVFEEMTDVLSSMSKAVRDHKKEFKAFGEVVGAVWAGVKVSLKGAWQFIGNTLGYLTDAVQLLWAVLSNGGFVPLLVALAAMPTLLAAAKSATLVLYSALLVPAAVIAGLLLLDDLIVGLNGGDSALAAMAKQDGALGNLAAVLLTIGDTVASLGVAFAALVNGDMAILGMLWEDFTNRFSDNFPNLVKEFEKVGMWWSVFFDNFIARINAAFELTKSLATFDFKDAAAIRDSMRNIPILPTQEQLTGTSNVSGTQSFITNAPILNVTVNGSDPVGAQEIVTRALNESYQMIQQMSASNYQKDALNFPFVGG